MSETSTRYTLPQIGLHNLMALLIIALYAVGLSIDLFDKPVRPAIINLHALGGLLVLLLLVPRLLLKLRHPAPDFPSSMSPAFVRAARLGHAALYLLTLAVVLLGVPTFLTRGQSLDLFLFQIPSPLQRDHDLNEAILDYHGLAANILIALVAGHVLIALYHQFVVKDNLFARIDPRAKDVA